MAFFVYEIGYKLADGQPHSKRAFDYDDWKLNGDLIVGHKKLDDALELSSMEVRVDAKSLMLQKNDLSIPDFSLRQYHAIINSKDIPFTIGAGIWVSRILMFIGEAKYLGKLRSSVGTDEIVQEAKNQGIKFLF